MTLKRIIYAIITLASFAAFIYTDSSIALFLFVGLIVLPLFSFIALLIAKHSVKFDCEVGESCMRGGALQITMKLGVRPRMFVSSAKVVAVIENTTFHKSERAAFLFEDLSYTPHTHEYKSELSGRVCITFDRVKLFGFFGLFSINVKCLQFAESIVSPVLHENMRILLGESKINSNYGEVALPQKGNDITEIFNIRDYVAGDPLNAVHWKLSSKFDTLMSKDFGSTDDRHTLILVDMSRNKGDFEAPDSHLNAVLDIAASISDSLKVAGSVHSVGWFSDGIFNCSEVSDNETFVQMIYKLMSIKVNERNEEDLFYLVRERECSMFTKIVYITTSVSVTELKQIDVNITAVCAGDNDGIIEKDNIKVINIACDNIQSSLAECVL